MADRAEKQFFNHLKNTGQLLFIPDYGGEKSSVASASIPVIDEEREMREHLDKSGQLLFVPSFEDEAVRRS